MSIDLIIQQAVSEAVKSLYNIEVAPESIVLQATRREFEGNFTVVVFPWVKAAHAAPDPVTTPIVYYIFSHSDT